MTAWSVLIGNSTLPASAIAWNHLNNQAGGGGGSIIVGGIRTANMQQSLSANASRALSANLNKIKLTASKPVVLSAGIKQKLEARICQ